jgi:hypothetical protein
MMHKSSASTSPVMKRRDAHALKSRFRIKYESGEIPIRVSHRGMNGVTWRVDPSSVDLEHMLPLFFTGITEIEHPYRLLAVRGCEDLIKSARSARALAETLPRLILPIKAALNTRDPRILAVAFDLIYILCSTYPEMSEHLLPYHRQLLPAFNQWKNVDTVYVSLVNLASVSCWRERKIKQRARDESNTTAVGDDTVVEGEAAIGYGRSKRSIGSLVRRALAALERGGGMNTLESIQYIVPCYRSHFIACD